MYIATTSLPVASQTYVILVIILASVARTIMHENKLLLMHIHTGVLEFKLCISVCMIVHIMLGKIIFDKEHNESI